MNSDGIHGLPMDNITSMTITNDGSVWCGYVNSDVFHECFGVVSVTGYFNIVLNKSVHRCVGPWKVQCAMTQQRMNGAILTSSDGCQVRIYPLKGSYSCFVGTQVRDIAADIDGNGAWVMDNAVCE